MKNIILSLIKDDIRHTRLVDGLNALGLPAHEHCLHLPEIIFSLMEIDHKRFADELMQGYFGMVRKKVDQHNENQLANNIYEYLNAFSHFD